MKHRKKICVVGLGYIGLPTASLLANRGYNVHGFDIVPEVVETINKGKVHIVEPELDTFVKSAVKSGNLKASTTPAHADIFIIAVPTPIRENNQPDINYIIASAKSIAPYIRRKNIVILESTSPVGTTEYLEKLLKENGVNTAQIYIAYCPERVLPGQTMRELVENDRIVGGFTEESAEKVKHFYKTFVQGEIFITNARTAELCKLVENSYRDVNIAFANELSVICDKLGINIWELIALANRHPRVKILKPGSGVGGHCIAVDPWFIVSTAKQDAKLIRTAREVNNYKPLWVLNKIKLKANEFYKKHKRKPLIACMGIAFKPDIDDLRESPALEIVDYLKKENYNILVVEPNIERIKDFELYDYKEAVKKADIVLFLVAHEEFKRLKIEKDKIIIDICGITCH